MRNEKIALYLFILPYFAISCFFILGLFSDVKITKRLKENHPYFTYPWYKKLFLLGLNKHKYLTIMAFVMHACNFIFLCIQIVYIYFMKNLNILIRMGGGFGIVGLVLFQTILWIREANKGKWDFNK